jgi:hypothetical protein
VLITIILTIIVYHTVLITTIILTIILYHTAIITAIILKIIIIKTPSFGNSVGFQPQAKNDVKFHLFGPDKQN